VGRLGGEALSYLDSKKGDRVNWGGGEKNAQKVGLGGIEKS